MDRARDQALLRDIWQVQSEELPVGHGRTCKAMKHVGFAEVDDDLRAAWWAKLEREGKRGARTVADLLAERRDTA
jgi:hypothetical protein